MKFFELETKHETASIVYIDMDGVLADFFWRSGTVRRHQHHTGVGTLTD